LIPSVGHQGHETSELDGVSDLTLVLGAKLRSKVWSNLKLPRHKLTEKGGLFVINNFDFFLATNALCFDHDMFLNEASNSDCEVELLENCHPVNLQSKIYGIGKYCKLGSILCNI